ncbi:MAG: LTA synthase family protein [Deltaproteobacteria bacterium]|nr:LTA synthase family protein [Deltaproteobacteria bacterium]
MQGGVTGSAPSRVALALLGLLLAPLTLRLLLGFELAGGFEPEDLRGLLSDLFASALAFTLLVPVGRLSRGLAALLLLPWVLLHYGNYELVRTLGAMATLPDAHYLGDATFVQGSATAVSRPFLLGGLALASLALGWLGLDRLRMRHAAAGAALALALLAISGLWPWSASLPMWRQADLVQRELGRLASAASRSGAPATGDPAAAMLEQVPDLAANLDGEPRFPLPGKPRNVLLVILESVSGAYLEQLLVEHWGRGEGSMPVLDSIAQRNLGYATFIGHQRRTNRGLYALLCGEIPNLLAGVPKMSSYAIDGTRRCLPEILGDAGYTTTYLQAAPLVFMLKDQFMPRIGFQQVHGDEWFAHAYARSTWGVDDRAFLEQSTRMITQLEAEERPWFLTLLTVGTHHPYVVPADFESEMPSDFMRTIAYLDRALEGFMERLEALGILDDTLVLFTSDESQGHQWGQQQIPIILSQNWGFLVALTPEQARGLVREPFAQMDLPLSILDYLGLEQEGRHLWGRSVFRSYAEPRSIFFANSNLQMTGVFDREGRLVVCLDDFARCQIRRPQGGRLFGGDHESLLLEGSEVQRLRELAVGSVRRRPKSVARLEIDLQATQHETVKGPIARLVHGGQFIDVAADEWIEVEIEVAVRPAAKQSPDGSGVLLFPILRTGGRGAIHQDEIVLEPGERLHLVYTYAPGRAVREVQSQLMARSPDGGTYELDFERARISLIRGAERPGRGVEVRRQEIDGG